VLDLLRGRVNEFASSIKNLQKPSMQAVSVSGARDAPVRDHHALRKSQLFGSGTLLVQVGIPRNQEVPCLQRDIDGAISFC